MRRLVVVGLVLGSLVTAAPAHAERTSTVSVADPAGDAYGYWYVDPDHDVDAPPSPTLSDAHYDILRLTTVATPRGVRLTVHLAAPIADAGETVWVGLTQVEGDCTLLVRVSDTMVDGRPTTALANWCGQGLLVNSVSRADAKDARASEPTAFVPYSAFPGAISTHGSVKVRAETMRDLGGATTHVARVTLDGVMAATPLRLLGSR